MSHTTAPSETAKSPYCLDQDSSITYTLPDGRKIGYAQYGSLTGRAVFYLHGMPGSRIEAAAFNDMAVRIGVRVIAVDRPGYGWSSPQPNRTLLDHPRDIEKLAEHLKLNAYGVMVHIIGQIISRPQKTLLTSETGSIRGRRIRSCLGVCTPRRQAQSCGCCLRPGTTGHRL